MIGVTIEDGIVRIDTRHWPDYVISATEAIRNSEIPHKLVGWAAHVLRMGVHLGTLSSRIRAAVLLAQLVLAKVAGLSVGFIKYAKAEGHGAGIGAGAMATG